MSKDNSNTTNNEEIKDDTTTTESTTNIDDATNIESTTNIDDATSIESTTNIDDATSIESTTNMDDAANIESTATTENVSTEKVELEEPKDSKEFSKAEARHEDNLELRRMKFFKRMQAKRERIKANTEGMSNWEKFKYFVYYYKWHVVLGALLIFCAIAIPMAIYKNSRPVSISYAVVNSPAPEQINEKLFNEYASYYNILDGYQIRNSLYVTLSQKDYETEFGKEEGDSSYTQFPTLCWNNYFDIIITNETGLNYCSVNGLIQPIEDRLYDDIYTAIKEKYPRAIVTSLNYDDDPVEYAIDISGTEFATKLNVGYDKVYVCFPGESEQNTTNLRRFLNYVLNLDIEI